VGTRVSLNATAANPALCVPAGTTSPAVLTGNVCKVAADGTVTVQWNYIKVLNSANCVFDASNVTDQGWLADWVGTPCGTTARAAGTGWKIMFSPTEQSQLTVVT
jgi:hypothetical protein